MRFHERVDQGDGAAGADVDGVGSPGVSERAAGGVVHGPIRPQRERLRTGAPRHGDVRAPRRARLQVCPEGVHGLLRLHARRDPHAHHRPGHRHDLVRGLHHARRVDAQHRDRRLRPQPLRDRTVSGQLEALHGRHICPVVRLVVVDLSLPVAVEAGDGHVATVVVQARQHPRQRHDGVGHRTAVHAAVHRVFQRPDLDQAVHQPTQRRGETGDAEAPVRGVREHQHVGAQHLPVLLEEPGQVLGARLLLALDEHLHADGRLRVVRPDGGHVRRDPGLVVVGPPPVQPPVPNLRLERRRVPVRGVPRGLDVVVGVQQHGRRSGRPRHLAEHGRVGLAVLQEPHAL